MTDNPSNWGNYVTADSQSSGQMQSKLRTYIFFFVGSQV